MAVHLVLLAGGQGTRFWPLSRKDKPKQLLPLLGSETLLRRTWQRISPLGRAGRAWVIAGESMLPACRREIPEIPGDRFIGEPAGRNTAAAIALAGQLALAEDPQAVLAVFPCDHHIADTKAFRRLARQALAEARNSKSLFTLGISPSRPDEAYGYIETAARAVSGRSRPVLRFAEKPKKATARRWIKTGRFLWNSGMFFFRADSLRDAFLATTPGIWQGLDQVPGGKRNAAFRRRLADRWPSIQALPFDVAVMEKAKSVRVIPAKMGWDDVGNWLALAEHLPAVGKNRSAGAMQGLAATNNIIFNPDGLTAVVGASDLVIVRRGETILVCHRDRVGSIRDLVADLAAEGFEDEL